MTTPSPWKNQIVGYGEEPPESLLAHPMNPKIHPKAQQDALAGAISEVGWISPVVVNRTTAHVLDGHARIGLAISRGEPTVPIAYVEISPEQEAYALATLDPIGAMAFHDREQLDALLQEVSTGDAAVQAMLDQLAQDAGIVPIDGAPPDLTAGRDGYKEQYGVIVICADEREQERVYETLKGEGYTVRVVTT